MNYKIGSKGRAVTEIQGFLRQKGFWPTNQVLTEYFGETTEKYVKLFQSSVGLKPDGIVGDNTYNALLRGTDAGDAVERELLKISDKNYKDTDRKLHILSPYKTKLGLEIRREYLDTDQYVRDFPKLKKKYFYIHHTAGWSDASAVANAWNADKLGRICTQYNISGSDIYGRQISDGKVVECFGNDFNGWHLGSVHSHQMHKEAVGVELCNFGYLKLVNGEYITYTGAKVIPSEVCDLGKNFRGHRYWHKYSKKQIESLRLLMHHVRDVHGIDIAKGLPELLRSGVDPFVAFEYYLEVSQGKKIGTWTHTNVRKDKFDCFPQPELVAMLKAFS